MMLSRPFFVTVVLFTSLTLGGLPAHAADSLLSMERIFNKPYIAGSRPESADLSPDGTLILYRWDSTARNNYRLWISTSDGLDARQIADTLVGECAWGPDSRTIACTRKGDIYLTDSSFARYTRLTRTDAYEGNLHWTKDGSKIIFESDGKIVSIGVTAFSISELARPTLKDGSLSIVDCFPDDKHVLFTESTNDSLPEFLVPKFTGKDVSTRSFKSGIGKRKIGIAPVDTGLIIWIKLPGEERYYPGDMGISPNGKRVFVEKFSADRKKREIFIADTDSGKPQLVYSESDPAWIEGGLAMTRWLPDGNALITTSERDGWNHLYLIPLNGKNAKKLTSGDWEIHWFDIPPSGKRILFDANREERSQWQLYSYSLTSGEITKLSALQGTYENPRMSKDGSCIVADYSNFARPADLVRILSSVVQVPERLITHTVPSEFSSAHWTVPEIISFKARDGVMIPAMVYKPADFLADQKYPVIVFVHGAGYLQNVYRGWSYYYREYLFHHRLVQKGYIVFEVEYRGSAGLGRKFRSDVYMHLGGKDLDDEVDGLEYLNHLGYIDPQRVGIYGGSYGGFMALMALMTTNHFACGAALRAVTSWENYYRHNHWYTEARLGTPEDHPDAYRISSPLTYADSLKKPLLILHGMSDDNVFFQDAVQLIAKLQKAHKKFEVMVYPDEAHSFTEPESWYDEYSRIEEFFDKNLR